jgi:hypothetical protein
MKKFFVMAFTLASALLISSAHAEDFAETFNSIKAIQGSTCSMYMLNTAVCRITVLGATADGKMVGPVHCFKAVADKYRVTVDELFAKITEVGKAICGSTR